MFFVGNLENLLRRVSFSYDGFDACETAVFHFLLIKGQNFRRIPVQCLFMLGSFQRLLQGRQFCFTEHRGHQGIALQLLNMKQDHVFR
jgi:hypothetical protein